MNNEEQNGTTNGGEDTAPTGTDTPASEAAQDQGSASETDARQESQAEPSDPTE